MVDFVPALGRIDGVEYWVGGTKVEEVPVGSEVGVKVVFTTLAPCSARVCIQVDEKDLVCSPTWWLEERTWITDPFRWVEKGPEGEYVLKVWLYINGQQADYREFTYTVVSPAPAPAPTPTPPPEGKAEIPSWVPVAIGLSIVGTGLAVLAYKKPEYYRRAWEWVRPRAKAVAEWIRPRAEEIARRAARAGLRGVATAAERLARVARERVEKI